MQCTKSQRTLGCGVSYAVVHIHEPILWAPTPPEIVEMAPKKQQSPRKCTSYNIIRYFIGRFPLYYC